MAAIELPRPGVEIVQEFTSASPTIVTPTLVPCNVAPFFEVIEALNSDGTINDDAKLTDQYEQLELTIGQSSFPSPRGNIDEVNVTEDSVRTFFEFGGAIIELSREQAFLTSFNDPDYATQPYVRGTEAEPVGGYDVDGRTLILSMDGHNSLSGSEFVAGSNCPTSNDVTITFAAAISGGNLTLAEVIVQINALFPNVASEYVSTHVLQLQSTKFGAAASVIVRSQGTANAGVDRLGFDADHDTLAVGSGFYADDDSDGDLTSPRLKIYEGSLQLLRNVYVSGPLPQIATLDPFLDAHMEVGDSIVADGVLIGDTAQVESDILTMEVEQNLISHDNSFAPRRVWVQANDLSYPAPAASTAASLTGTVQTAVITSAYIASQAAPDAAGDCVIPAAESLVVNIVKAGVALPSYTVSSGSGWTGLDEVIAGINASPDVTFEAYYANEYGDELPVAYWTANPTLAHLGLRTLADNRSSGAALTVVSSTVALELGFTSLPLGDVGENIRYRPGTPSIITTTVNPFSARTISEFTTYIPLVGGLAPDVTPETITWTAGHATIAAAIADWNDQARYTEAYEANVSGVETTDGGYFAIRTRGENVGTGASIEITAVEVTNPLFTIAAAVTGTDTDLNGLTFIWSLDLNLKQYAVTFVTDEDDSGVSLQQVLDKINAETPNVASASVDTPPYLTVGSNKVGEASEMVIHAGTGNAALGHTDNSATPERGDGRPAPDMAIDVAGDLILQSQLLRDGLTSTPYSLGTAPLIIAYKGLRLDLSPDADNPALFVIDDVETLELAADPISTDNPGALMMFLSLINAPSVSIAGIGVPEISADAPDGTPLGYAKCAEFLENEEVYALATASHLTTVHQTFLTHVSSMSEPEQKGERIYFFNPAIPNRALPDLVGSGTDANSTATANEIVVEVNIAPALIAAGLDPNADLNPLDGAIENEVYLDLGGDDNCYLIQKVTDGVTLTLRTTFEAGDGNDDSFFSTTALPASVISDDWTVYIRGAQLLISGTTRPDYGAIAEAIQGAGQGYGVRRGFYVHPDQVAINVTGLEQVVDGYYGTSCVVGMVGELPPQQGFTNYPITGLTRVVGSSDKFTQRQLNVMAAGGIYILIQDNEGAPVKCRHQLSTDMTSIEVRELSITKVVDYTAKFMRAGLRNFIGRSNITQPFLDNLSTVIQGQINFLVEGGVLNGADINNIIQDADAPDTILVDVTLDVPYPCNYLRLTLVL